MNKDNLLRQIADTAYNVGYGAKKHFATYDIVDKTPGLIAFGSMSVGIFGLVFDCLSAKSLSAFFLVLGIAGLYIERYNETKNEFRENGEKLTQIFNELKVFYFRVKSSGNDSFDDEQNELDEISARFNVNCVSKQIMFSDWFAHYKFFWQHQIEWINEQKHFKFWRDKMPLSLSVFTAMFLLVAFGCFIWRFTS